MVWNRPHLQWNKTLRCSCPFSPRPTWPFTANLILSKSVKKTKGGLTIYSPSRSAKVGGSRRKIWGRNPKSWQCKETQPPATLILIPRTATLIDRHHIHPSPCPRTLGHGFSQLQSQGWFFSFESQYSVSAWKKISVSSGNCTKVLLSLSLQSLCV